MKPFAALPLLACAVAPSACIAPSVVSSGGRQVSAELAPARWRPGTAADLPGFYESERIEGESAAALARIYYSFAADGTFTGAALVLGGAHPEFQTLSGSWTFQDGTLDLGDGQPIGLDASEGRIRLASAGGTAVLKRIAVE